MSKVLRTTDNIKISVGEVSFIISPLSYIQKLEISEQTKVGPGGNEVFDMLRAQLLMVKYGLKGIEGVKGHEGDDYVLEFENGHLSDNCLTEIFNIKEKSKFLAAAWQCLDSYPDKLTDPMTNEELEGVALELIPNKAREG